MKIKCKCGRTLVLDVATHAGKKVACKACGQRYRLPAAKPRDPTVQMAAWKPDDADPVTHDPKEVGAEALGEKISVSWIFISFLLTLVIGIGGAYGVKVALLPKLASDPDLAKVTAYVKLALWWGPMLAFVIAGWLTARLSPGKTITEPALGAALSVAAMVALVIFQPGPVADLLGGLSSTRVAERGVPEVANVFAMAMFNAAMLACAGAYFGEVAQERASV